jgi:LiaI-LiaF-like transmembrane region
MSNDLNANSPQVSPVPPTPPEPPVPPAAATGVVRQKSPGLAVLFSFFPGLGHLYLGLYDRAIVFFSCFFLVIYLGGHGANLGMLIPFIWFFGLFDAYRQTQILNSSKEEEMPAARKPRGHGGLGFGVFLTIVGVILLIDKFYPLDLEWVETWWPAILIVIGIYLIASFYGDRKKRQRSSYEESEETYLDE